MTYEEWKAEKKSVYEGIEKQEKQGEAIKKAYEDEYRNGFNSLNKAKNNGIIKSLEVDDFEIRASRTNLMDEVKSTIIQTIKDYEDRGGVFFAEVSFGDFYDEKTGHRAMFQTDLNKYGMTVLNINTEMIGGLTVDEINIMLARTKRNLPLTLREAIIHGCGHARAYYGKSYDEIVKMNNNLENIHIEGVSKSAKQDGAECVAEVEVLLSRGNPVPEEAMKLYEKYTGGKNDLR